MSKLDEIRRTHRRLVEARVFGEGAGAFSIRDVGYLLGLVERLEAALAEADTNADAIVATLHYFRDIEDEQLHRMCEDYEAEGGPDAPQYDARHALDTYRREHGGEG